MNIEAKIKSALKIGWRRIIAASFSAYGGIVLLVSALALVEPEIVSSWGWQGFWIPIGLAILFALFYWFPYSEYSNRLPTVDSTIRIKVGDLFEEKDYLVIGTNNVFDTELGEIIKEQSIQGQFLNRVYGGNLSRLDEDIQNCLLEFGDNFSEDTLKVRGKIRRYKTGTVITLGSLNTRYFLVAYGNMGADLVCTSNATSIIDSLNCLWDEIRKKGQGNSISMPIIGSDLARTNLSRMTLIRIIVGSFILASKKQFITKQLTIMIHPKDLEQVNMYELRDFIHATSY